MKRTEDRYASGDSVAKERVTILFCAERADARLMPCSIKNVSRLNRARWLGL